MRVFTTPADFKKHKKYIPMIRKALKKVKADPGKHFYYFAKYPFVEKTLPLVLVDFTPECRKAIKASGVRVTAKGMVTLTDDDELKFTPKEGKVNSIKLKKYFRSMSSEIKDVFIPVGEVDEDDEDDSGTDENNTDAQANQVFEEAISSDAGSLNEKFAARLKAVIADLQTKQFQPKAEAKKDQALKMATSLVEEGSYTKAGELLKSLRSWVLPDAETDVEAEAKQVFEEAASSDAGGLNEKFAARLKAVIADLQTKQFQPKAEAKKDQALKMAADLVEEGSYTKAGELLKSLRSWVLPDQAASSVDDKREEASEAKDNSDAKAKEVFEEDVSSDADSMKEQNAIDIAKKKIAMIEQMPFPAEQMANKSSTLKKAQKLVAAGNHAEATRLLNGLAEIKARQVRVAASQISLDEMGKKLAPDEKNVFPAGLTKEINKATSRKVGGHGELFKLVLKAMEGVERSTDEKDLDVLDKAAGNYLKDLDQRISNGLKPDKVTTSKAEACKDAIERVRKLRVARNIQEETAKLPTSPQTADEEAAVNQLKAKMIVESGGSKQLGADLSGASESFFLTDPTTEEKAFIFKPADGEFDAGYGWKKGGGAPREVALSAVNEALKSSIGLDCGVSQTTMVAVDNPAVATDRNGNNSKRTGAVQEFVNSNRELSGKLEDDSSLINQVPAQEIEKVALLDFATLQMDRQASNLLIQEDENGQQRLIPIDAGNALPSRKAFEASRRMFTNNAVLAGDEAKKPFSADALKQIDEINADEIVAAMKKANADMAAIDPDMASAVDDENIEMTRRSIHFLKKAAPQLTKAEIADAYANEFQKVLDAKPKDVDNTIDKAIKATQDKPVIIGVIDGMANAANTYKALGWPYKAYDRLKGENPERLLDIIQKGIECPAILEHIKQAIAEVGLENFDTDPNTIKDIAKRKVMVDQVRLKFQKEKILGDPELDKKMKKAGATWEIISKAGEKMPMAETNRQKHAERINDYIESGGDDVVKRRGKSPRKMSFEEKYFESLGGDEAIQELKRKNLNPYDEGDISYKINDIENYKTYEALGGDEEYVRLGGPQNKEVNLDARVSFMRLSLLLE